MNGLYPWSGLPPVAQRIHHKHELIAALKSGVVQRTTTTEIPEVKTTTAYATTMSNYVIPASAGIGFWKISPQKRTARPNAPVCFTCPLQCTLTRCRAWIKWDGESVVMDDLMDDLVMMICICPSNFTGQICQTPVFNPILLKKFCQNFQGLVIYALPEPMYKTAKLRHPQGAGALSRSCSRMFMSLLEQCSVGGPGRYASCAGAQAQAVAQKCSWFFLKDLEGSSLGNIRVSRYHPSPIGNCGTGIQIIHQCILESSILMLVWSSIFEAFRAPLVTVDQASKYAILKMRYHHPSQECSWVFLKNAHLVSPKLHSYLFIKHPNTPFPRCWDTIQAFFKNVLEPSRIVLCGSGIKIF